jgi:hypothetical protein
VSKWTLPRILFVVAFVCLLLSALIAGGLVKTLGGYVPWVLGGFAAVALAWANP